MCFARSTKYCACHETLRQASKQARAAHLWILCAAGGGAAPPPNPPRATKSALHPRHPRLPRNQYFKVNSPVPNFSNQANMQPISLYLSIYLPIYVFIDPFIFLSVYLQFNIHKVLHLPRNLHICTPRKHPQSPAPATKCALQGPQSTAPATKHYDKQASEHELLTFGSGVLLGGGAAPPPTPPAPRNLHFIPDTRACHEINILR